MNKPGMQWLPTNAMVTGRCAPGQVPLTIVLHEVDVPLQTLDAQIQGVTCDPDECGLHTSFHYGVSGAIIHNYVNPADQSCSFADPLDNCTTINIAVVTGVTATIPGGCFAPNNAYGETTLDSLCHLIAWLMQTYNLPITAVVRHLKELKDLPWDKLVCCIDEVLNEPVPVPPICITLNALPPASVVPPTVTVVDLATCTTVVISTTGSGAILNPVDCLGVPINLAAAPALATCANLIAAVPVLSPVDCLGAPIDLTAAPELVTCDGLLTVLSTVLDPVDCQGVPIDLTASPALATCADLIAAVPVLNPVNCLGLPIDLTAAPALALCSDIIPVCDIPVGTYDPTLPLSMFQSQLGACVQIQMPPAQPATCATNPLVTTALSPQGWGQVQDYLTPKVISTDYILVPATDNVILARTNLTVNLTIPGPCDRQDFWITNLVPANTVIINGAGPLVGSIPAITLNGAGPWTLNQGETAHIVWSVALNGWIIL